MDREEKIKFGVGCAGCLVFIGLILFAISWDSVEPTEWGLKYNSLTKSIDDKGNFLPSKTVIIG